MTDKDIAENGLIFKCYAGSRLFGLETENSDTDIFGVCVEPLSHVIGLNSFEQYHFQSHPDGTRASKDDVEGTIYSLRKFVRLAMQGNPTIILPLFAPNNMVLREDFVWTWLRDNRDFLLSKNVGARFLGYSRSQSHDIVERKTRPELVEAYGYDTKAASHMVRLLVQCFELLVDGTITLPMPEETRKYILDIKLGKISEEEVFERTTSLEKSIEAQILVTSLPDKPDYEKANKFLINAYVKSGPGW